MLPRFMETIGDAFGNTKQYQSELGLNVYNAMGWDNVAIYNTERRHDLQRQYNKMLVQKNYALSRGQLKKLNTIDLRPFLFEPDDPAIDTYQMPFDLINDIIHKYSKDNDMITYSNMAGFYVCVPCFSEGVLHITRDRYIYWKIQELKIHGEDRYIKIYLKDYIAYPEYWQPGVEGNLTIPYEIETDILGTPKFKDIKTSDDIQFSKMFRLLTPQDLAWSNEDYEFFKKTCLNMADTTDLEMAKAGTNNFRSLSVTFMALMSLINFQLYKNKPVANRKANKAKTKVIVQTVDEKQPKQLIRNVGTISIKSVKPPRLPSEETVIHYKVAQWTARGGLRHMKDGRIIPFKESVRRRKCLQDKTSDVPTSIIRIRKDTNYE